MNRRLFAPLFAITALAAGGAANADMINFGQFGSDYTELSNTLVGVTNGGVGFTMTGPGSGFEELVEDEGWAGDFPESTPVLYDNGSPGSITIVFDAPISSISELAMEANIYGASNATLDVYSGALLIGTQTYTSTTQDDPGTVPSFDFSGSNITSIVLSESDDGEGLGLGGAGGTGGYTSAAPEPASWALMLLGIGGLGMAFRTHRRWNRLRVSAAIA